MSKKCCIPVPSEQKRLLKVLTCLYENYVLNQTPSTDAYLVNPTSDGYASMEEELNAISTLINNYLNTNKVFVDISGNNIAQVDLWASVAQGMVHYNSAVDNNSFVNAIENMIYINGTISNVGVLKTVQKLNIDDCVEKSYQVTPVTNSNGDSSVNVTQASLVERVGCQGVSNLGFLGMTLQVPIANAPFNNCYITRC